VEGCLNICYCFHAGIVSASDQAEKEGHSLRRGRGVNEEMMGSSGICVMIAKSFSILRFVF